ncbi:hypothetical protein GGX14DRAFT_601165 [Mycena pura]|uniref:Uncharacterized protein n=1 Tax=Mycena pura TaxID=153505 RepID=A0AAD6XX52_9AGAR|nr:hypothetical protein GGX14DRAFT_601165 [Mycena pura]
MRSFSQIAALAVVALAALAAAAPVAEPKRQLKSLPTIFDELRSNMAPVTDGLNSLTADTATPATLTAFAQQMSDIISPAVTQISALAGSPVGTILATSDGVLTPTQATQRITSFFITVYGATTRVSLLTRLDWERAASTIQPQLNEMTYGVPSAFRIQLTPPRPQRRAELPHHSHRTGLRAYLGSRLAPISSTGPALGLLDGII